MRSGDAARCAALSLLMGAAPFAVVGCHQSGDASAAARSPKATGMVVLTQQQIAKIGLETSTVKATLFTDEVTGYGSVVAHDSIAEAQAQLISAQATARQSEAALARARRLAGTAGALSAETEEASARQAQVDAAALTLARQRLSATFGLNPLWSDGGDLRVLRALANGSPKLVRITFPLGVLPADPPKRLYALRIGGPSGARWKMTVIWRAPADANMPGRSFFAILNGADVGEGERILVRAPVGAAEPGVVIPQSAVVIDDGKYWCYREENAGTFVRTQIDARRAVDDGYFLSEGVKAGDNVVVKGAAQLLAQESLSGAEAG